MKSQFFIPLWFCFLSDFSSSQKVGRQLLLDYEWQPIMSFWAFINQYYCKFLLSYQLGRSFLLTFYFSLKFALCFRYFQSFLFQKAFICLVFILGWFGLLGWFFLRCYWEATQGYQLGIILIRAVQVTIHFAHFLQFQNLPQEGLFSLFCEYALDIKCTGVFFCFNSIYLTDIDLQSSCFYGKVLYDLTKHHNLSLHFHRGDQGFSNPLLNMVCI